MITTPTTTPLGGTFTLGDLTVHRLGFGAMRLTGDGVWGPPGDRREAIAVLRRAVELGVDLIDTAESYGPHVSEELIAEALYPYPKELVIATKGGFDRSGPHKWAPNGRPERLRDELEGSLRRLRLDRIDLWQLHRVDPKVPADEQFGAIRDFVREGRCGMPGYRRRRSNRSRTPNGSSPWCRCRTATISPSVNGTGS
jgi:aryl-alcohol dehydrogenase-like predicted oxidoreductase